MGKLSRDKHHTIRVEYMLLLNALRPTITNSAKVAVPTKEQITALESVRLEVARILLSCSLANLSDVTWAYLGVQSLSSR